MPKTKIVIVVAGGKGERMQTDIPKQFIEINGKPILMHTLEVFYRYDNSIQLIVVLPEAQIKPWRKLCIKHSFSLTHQVVAGGETRFHSVKNGIDAIRGASLVAIHDGVRPLVNIDTIARCFYEAEKYGAAIPVIDLVESIRHISGKSSNSMDRTKYKLVQTPQVFNSLILKKAYKRDYSPFFTDDASVVEALGIKIELVKGNRENIKITTPFDLKIAETLLKFENEIQNE